MILKLQKNEIKYSTFFQNHPTFSKFNPLRLKQKKQCLLDGGEGDWNSEGGVGAIKGDEIMLLNMLTEGTSSDMLGQLDSMQFLQGSQALQKTSEKNLNTASYFSKRHLG